jgi:hypothetical protein
MYFEQMILQEAQYGSPVTTEPTVEGSDGPGSTSNMAVKPEETIADISQIDLSSWFIYKQERMLYGGT